MENLTHCGLALLLDHVYENNTFKLQNLEGEEVSDGLVNGRFLKLYFVWGSEALLLQNIS